MNGRAWRGCAEGSELQLRKEAQNICACAAVPGRRSAGIALSVVGFVFAVTSVFIGWRRLAKHPSRR